MTAVAHITTSFGKIGTQTVIVSKCKSTNSFLNWKTSSCNVIVFTFYQIVEAINDIQYAPVNLLTVYSA